MSHPRAILTAVKRPLHGRRVAAALAGSAALVALTATAAPTAQAAIAPPSGGSWDHIYTGTGVTVYVKEHGDVVSVCDTSANGHSAWAQVMDTTTSRYYIVTASGGKGTCASHSADESYKYDIPEDTWVNVLFEGAGGQGTYTVSFFNDH